MAEGKLGHLTKLPIDAIKEVVSVKPQVECPKSEILGVLRGYAYKIIRGLNNELKEKGYRVISGKVPTKYFEEKFYGMAVG